MISSDPILLIGNDVEFSRKHKGVFERSFSEKDLGEAAYILGIVGVKTGGSRVGGPELCV